MKLVKLAVPIPMGNAPICPQSLPIVPICPHSLPFGDDWGRLGTKMGAGDVVYCIPVVFIEDFERQVTETNA